MDSTNIGLISNNGSGVFEVKPVKWEKGFGPHIRRHETEENRMESVTDMEQVQNDDSSICSTSAICPPPLSRQFWRAGNYDDLIHSKPANANQNGTSYLRIHPKFLHSNATSHKWAFGAMAELLDNSVDEIQNGATFVIVDKTSNPRDGTPTLLIQDDGGGMDPEAMRRCMSFGFSDKKSITTIGRYGNGFKTSSMRLGADVIVFSRHTSDRKLTQSIGLLSYTFLMQTHQDRIVVPMVDYMFDSLTGKWKRLQQEQQFNTNLSILLQWSPFTTEAELLKQCDEVGPKGTKVIVYSLWHNDEGKLELNFDVDPEDICISDKSGVETEKDIQKQANKRHLANRLRFSLRAYLSVLYLRIPGNFSMILRGRAVEYHSIANDLKYPECIMYKPQHESPVITTIGFLKEAPAVNIHGFNVYHKNRLILPFWHVVTYSDSRGRGVVGILEANFIEPTHNKQDFEKTPVFQKLETRLKEMTLEYWDYRCGLLGYQVKKKPRALTTQFSADSDSGQGHNATYQPVLIGRESPASVGAKVSTATIPSNQMGIRAPLPQAAVESGITKQSFIRNSQGEHLKRKGHDLDVKPERVKRMGAIESRTTDIVLDGNDFIESANPFEVQEGGVHIIQENQRLHTECEKHEKEHDQLNVKVARLEAEIKEARQEYARLLLESNLLDRVNRALT